MDWLWKSPTTPKLKLFLWLVWWHRLPTNSLLTLRNITPSDMCPLCNNHVETISHILRECDVAKAVWLASQIPTMPNYTPKTEAWLSYHLLSSAIANGVLVNFLFPFVCWELWTQRNKKIFENIIIPPPNVTLNKAIQAASELYSYSPPSKTIPSTLAHPNLPSLHLPWLNLSVDASFVKFLSLCGVVGVLFDIAGRWLSGFQRQIYANDNLHAELLGILWGHLCSPRAWSNTC